MVIRLKVPIEMHYTVIPMGTSKVNSSQFCYPCWTFTVKLYNFGCSYCVVTGCSQDRKEAQQQLAIYKR